MSPPSSTRTRRRARPWARPTSRSPASRCTCTADLAPPPPPTRARRSPAPMPTSVTMPALGESVTEGTVTRWLKQEGEQVEVDEPLLEVSTDKVDTEIPSPAAGVLSKILVAEDETVEVGAELAVIGGDGDGGGDAAPPASAEDEDTTQIPDQQVEDASPEPQ